MFLCRGTQTVHAVQDHADAGEIGNIAMNGYLVPGTFVRHPGEPDWGIGQVQSAIDGRVTVNFEHAGKRLINTAAVALEVVDADGRRPAQAPGTIGPEFTNP